ncbi:MAG: hypothetical protein AVDCRST_MAG73-2750, partial [uncultured Thermomicrobiales bacterium]
CRLFGQPTPTPPIANCSSASTTWRARRCWWSPTSAASWSGPASPAPRPRPTPSTRMARANR